MKIFIDVGGHLGETLEAVIDPIYHFDKIYCFEPVKHCHEKISLIKDKRIIAFRAGLLDEDKAMEIYFPGSDAASIYSDHEAFKNSEYTKDYQDVEVCNFLNASQFFKKNIKIDDHVVMKLNCEGSECLIIETLIRSDEYKKLNNILIDFDIEKIPSKLYLKEEVLKLLSNQNQVHHFPIDVQYGGGSHFGGIKKWLNLTNERETNTASYLKSYFWDLKNIASRKHLNFYKFALKKMFLKKRSTPLK